MWSLCFILNTSILHISLLKNRALKQKNHLHTEQSKYNNFQKISQDGIPANYYSRQVPKHSIHGNLTTPNYKNQINTFKTSVMKTQNYCLSVNNKKSKTEQSSPFNCFACWLSRSYKRAKQEPNPKHMNT